MNGSRESHRPFAAIPLGHIKGRGLRKIEPSYVGVFF